MTILDLDDVKTWDKVFDKFIRNDPYWNSIESALSKDTDDDFNSIIQGLGNSIEFVESEEIISLRQRCAIFLKNNYTHVAAYHACRPVSLDSYLINGITPANTTILVEEAKLFFNDTNAVEEVVNNMNKEHYGKEYFEHGRDKIGFFKTRNGSLKDSHYLEYGSELYQCIARRLGEWAINKMANQGTPTLIRCSLPIAWLDEYTTFPILHSYALAPVEQIILRIRKPNARFPILGAFMLTRSVPKEFIINTIDMTLLLKEKENI
jgi:hypothetical protein